MYILTALVAFAGSFVQSSSGFGYAIICMAIWPMFMPFYTASILEAIAAFLYGNLHCCKAVEVY